MRLKPAGLLLLIFLAAAGYGIWLLVHPPGPKEFTGSAGTSSNMPASRPAAATATQFAMRLHGSNTIGAQLGPALVSAFLRQNGASIRVETQAADESRVVASSGSEPQQAVEIQAHGSGTAFHDMTAGTADIGMASRRITPAEAQSLTKLGDMTSPASEHVLGLDGIAVIVSRSNPVTALTMDQIAGLFSGKISWSDVSGPAGPVNIYARDEKSGTWDTFRTLVLKEQSLAAGARRIEDSRALSDAVAGDVNGIGFVGLPYIGSARAVAVSERRARPLLPNRFTVATEDYPLSRRLFLYTASNPSPMVRRFIDFALSKAGQDIVDANGFVAQTVTSESSSPQTTTAPDPASAEYRRATAGAERLSLNFRFRTGSSQLDNKAVADLDRVTSFLADLKYTGNNVILLGFSDSTGDAAKNVALSKQRAGAVGEQFAERGVRPAVVTGFGAAMAVASNDTPDGREKNRRVEIWVKR